MVKKLYNKKLIPLRFFVVIFLFFYVVNPVLASDTQGTIDGTYKYAWGENIGWLNFGCDNCNVSVADTGLSGYAWSRQYGWINLNPSTLGIKNDAEGTLSGYAWGSNIGWIDFSGVVINSNGEFSGYATIKSDGSRISFNCGNGNVNSCGSADFKVKTDWRPYSKRPRSGHPMSSASAMVTISTSSPASSETPSTLTSTSENLITRVSNNISTAANSVYDSFLNLFKPKEKPVNEIVGVSKNAPISFRARWNLLPVRAIHEFVFAPLPYEIRTLASKFPALNDTLNNVGVKRFTDIDKLTNATLHIPNLAEELSRTIKNVGVDNLSVINNLKGVGLDIPGFSDINKIITNPNIGAGNIALIKGVPLSKFPLVAKKNLPAEFVFARVGGESVDLNVVLSFREGGQVIQRMSSLSSEKMRLVVKPISRPKSVIGYFVFKSATPKVSEINTQNQISRSSLTASALFSMNGLVEQVSNSTYPPAPFLRKGENSKALSFGEGAGGVVPSKTSPPASLLRGEGGQGSGEVIPIERKLTLSSFEYTDSDHDGIYTADVVSPATPGEYEVVTIIDYIDPALGARRMSMITVIDPEGYVFEKNYKNGIVREIRIPGAIVSLYYLNTATKKYELWPAKNYQQDNPQITDIRGTYSFLVPEGSYYFEIEAPGYNSYKGKVFVVAEGSGIHQNIELKSVRGWISLPDWRTILLIVVFLLLVVYNPVVRLYKKFYYRI